MSTTTIENTIPMLEDEDFVPAPHADAPSDAAADEEEIIEISHESELQQNLVLAKKGEFPDLCDKHFRGTCAMGDKCPLMHGLDDKRFDFTTIQGVDMPAIGSMYSWKDGTNSIILSGKVEASTITDARVADYGEWMGMDLETEGGLSWIARQALAAPVLAPWRQCKTNDGEMYYFNFASGESLWDHPMDQQVNDLYDKEKALMAVRRNEARMLVMAYRRAHGQGFYCLLSEMVSWVVAEPRAFAQ